MSFYGTLGTNYTQASTDLKAWTSVFNFTCTNSPMNVVDPGGNYLSWRFYRIAQGALPITVKLNLRVPALTKTNGLGMNLEGPIGFQCTIQASTNMLTWQSLTNFTGTASPQNFSDPATTNFSRRFYRAVKQ